MRTVILLRHAKSSWKHTGLSDHERPLNKRGRAAAPVIGQWLEEHGRTPDIILCSSSTRTQETVARLGTVSKPPTTIEVLAQLYHAGPETILDTLRAVSPKHHTVMIVGHEPGMGGFAEAFARRTAAHCLQAFEHFPTGAAAVFQTKTRAWEDVSFREADFIDFAKPRDLM